jgi:hypothetical protein
VKASRLHDFAVFDLLTFLCDTFRVDTIGVPGTMLIHRAFVNPAVLASDWTEAVDAFQATIAVFVSHAVDTVCRRSTDTALSKWISTLTS